MTIFLGFLVPLKMNFWGWMIRSWSYKRNLDNIWSFCICESVMLRKMVRDIGIIKTANFGIYLEGLLVRHHVFQFSCTILKPKGDWKMDIDCATFQCDCFILQSIGGEIKSWFNNPFLHLHHITQTMFSFMIPPVRLFKPKVKKLQSTEKNCHDISFFCFPFFVLSFLFITNETLLSNGLIIKYIISLFLPFHSHCSKLPRLLICCSFFFF